MHYFLLLIEFLCILGTNNLVSAKRKRVTREPGAAAPIDCLMSQWSEWGPCNPCAKERYRSRTVLRYGQFGGRACTDALGDRQLCIPDAPCPENPVDCGNDFQCGNEQCIKRRLVCNTENDCGDFSDEDDCDDTSQPPCRDRIIDVSEAGRTAGRGINILGMEPKESPFYNEFYNGLCDRVRDGQTGTYYRKPWNVAGLIYETKGDKRLRMEHYNSAVTAVKEIFSHGSITAEASASLKLSPTETKSPLKINVNSNFNANLEFSLNRFFSESRGKQENYFHVKGNIELGRFHMRSRSLHLTDTFLEDLKYLPSIYDKAEYFKFLETHGTHYAQKGIFGGKFEVLYVLDIENMKKEDVTLTDIKMCLGYTNDVNIEADFLDSKSGTKIQGCKSRKIKNADNSSADSIIHDVISLVEGGKSDVLIRLKEMLSRGGKVIDIEDYVQWAATLPEAPVVIQYEPYPISTLVPLTIPDSYIKKQNIDRAVEDYISEYNVCKCQPCQNGGTVMLLNGKCVCGCPPHFRGEACEIRASEFAPVHPGIDGGWSCWSDWSPCVNGERVRTRACNNPATSNGGKPCVGDDSSSSYC